ncbi:MAG: glutathione S-transferase family protein [Pseudomonadota bacterium]
MTIQVIGLAGSPYTRKMVAALRYRRIPYTLEWRHPLNTYEGRKAPKPALLPTLYFPESDEPVTDTTPILRRLEREVTGRALIPDDPATAFLCSLIEDYGDEWLTKPMFHYRWRYADDIETAQELIVNWAAPQLDDAASAQMAKAFGDRQISRLGYVGSNDDTAPVIEAGYQRFLEIINALIREEGYLFGGRPSTADFALYGQLTQLTEVDPTPAALAAGVSRRIRGWVNRLDDLSGLEPGEWRRDHAPLAPLLTEIGRCYVPLLLANDAAIGSGADQFETQVDGVLWRQATFSYQRKCLQWLREEFGALAPDARAEVEAALEPAGCLPLVHPSYSY